MEGGIKPAGARPRPFPHLALNGSGDRFGLLLIVLVASYVMSAFVSRFWVTALQVLLFVAAALLAVRASRLARRYRHLAAGAVLAGSAAAVALAFSGNTGLAVADLWISVILLLAVVLIVRRVLGQPMVTVQSILGAISAYMIIGLMFAAIYAAMSRFSGGIFFAGGKTGNSQTFQYFSFTTLTTLGYGDFTAAENSGRALAVMEALLGQVFLATLVARLVAAFRAPARRAAAEQDKRRLSSRAGTPARRRPAGTLPHRAPYRDRRRHGGPRRHAAPAPSRAAAERSD